MGLRIFLEELVLAELDALFGLHVLEPPHAVLVGRTGRHIVVPVAVEVVDDHVGTRRPEVCRMEWPRPLAGVFGLLPPAAGTQEVVAAIAVDVAHPVAVGEAVGAMGLSGGDGVEVPAALEVLGDGEPADLAFGLDGEHQDWLAGAQEVIEERGLPAGARPHHPLLPVAGLALRVFVPGATLAGEIDDDRVGPAIAIDVLGEVLEAQAVAPRGIVASDGPDLVHLPPGSLVPHVPGKDVEPAVAVDVRRCHALRAEGAVNDDFLEPDLAGRRARGQSHQSGHKMPHRFPPSLRWFDRARTLSRQGGEKSIERSHTRSLGASQGRRARRQPNIPPATRPGWAWKRTVIFSLPRVTAGGMW